MKNNQQSHHLYTVIVLFDDFTQGIEQYEAPSPAAAMARFIREAQCLQEFQADDRIKLISDQDIQLLHLAHHLQGVWVWVMAQSKVPSMKSVLGGQVIQTDRKSPRRANSSAPR
jgi:hypothetical protein